MQHIFGIILRAPRSQFQCHWAIIFKMKLCNLIPSSNPAEVNSFYSEKLFEKNKIIYKRGDGWPILVRRTEVIFYLDKEQRTLAVDSKHYHDNNKNVQNAAQICYEI